MTEVIPEADLVAVPPEADVPSAPLSRGAVCWALFEGARNPYVILITIYIFMPYVAAVTVVGRSTEGQEVISQWSQYSGWAVMATAPFLGASIDKLGPRKLWLALVVGADGPADGGAVVDQGRPYGPDGHRTMAMTTVDRHPVHLFGGAAQLAAGARRRPGRRPQGLGPGAGAGQRLRAWRCGFTAWAFALPGCGPTGPGFPRRRCSASAARCTSPSGWSARWRRRSSPRRAAALPLHARRAAHGRPGPHRLSPSGARALWRMIKTVAQLPRRGHLPVGADVLRRRHDARC